MAVAKAPVENEYRAHLRAEMKTRDSVEKAWRAATVALKEAEALVESGDKARVYLTRFLADVNRLSSKLREIDSYPRLLMNSCQDPALKGELIVRREIKANLASEWQRAEHQVQARKEEQLKVAAKIRAKLGNAGTAVAGEPLPWEPGAMRYASWVRSGDELLFDPGQRQMDQSNAQHYLAEWQAATQAIRSAEAVRDSIAERMRDADTAVDETRRKMMRSPV